MLTRWPAQIVRGFCMGAADVVPGVSGGTIALVFGIYEMLVHQVRTAADAGLRMVRLDLPGLADGLKRLEWGFLVPLAVGIVAAVLTLAGTIRHQLDTNPTDMAGLFFGLVAASILVAMRTIGRVDNTRLLVLFGSAAVTFVVLGARGGEVTDPQWFVVVAAGALAICAMILPGISGSFILLMLGMYDYVLGAIDDRDLAVVALFGIGAVVGLSAFSHVLDWSLRRHHDTVLAALVGLMAGSLRVLWPWPEGTDSARLAAPPADDLLGPTALAVVGAVAVLGIITIGSRASR